jgi:hypothetical protein
MEENKYNTILNTGHAYGALIDIWISYGLDTRF